MGVILGGIIVIGLGWVASKIWPMSDEQLRDAQHERDERGRWIYRDN